MDLFTGCIWKIVRFVILIAVFLVLLSECGNFLKINGDDVKNKISITKANIELNNIIQKIDQSEAQIDEIQFFAVNDIRNNSTDDISARYDELMKCQYQLQSLTDKLETLNESVDSDEALDDDINEFEGRVAQNNERLEDLDEQVRNLIKQIDDILSTKARITKQINDLDVKISKLQYNANKAIGANDTAELLDILSDLNNAQLQIVRLLSKLSELQGEREQKTELKELQKLVEELINKIRGSIPEKEVECYYVVGSEEELLANDIISKNWFGSISVNKDGYKKSLYVPGTISHLDAIHTYANDIEIISDMPSDSYLIREINGFKIVKISDSDKFWSETRYLVIVTND